MKNKKAIIIAVAVVAVIGIGAAVYYGGSKGAFNTANSGEEESGPKEMIAFTVDKVTLDYEPESEYEDIEEKSGYSYVSVEYTLENVSDSKVEAVYDDGADKWYSYGYIRIVDGDEIYEPVGGPEMSYTLSPAESFQDNAVFYLPSDNLKKMDLQVSIADDNGVIYRDYIDTEYPLKKYL